MEEQSDFIWQLIEQTPLLRQRIQTMDIREIVNKDEQVMEYIDFFKDLDLMLEEIRTNILIPSPQRLIPLNSKL